MAGSGVAAMAAQGALAGQPALVGPAGDGLGGNLQDGGHLGRPQEACRARRRPSRLAVHRDLTRCSGCRGRVTAPGPNLFRTWISRPARCQWVMAPSAYELSLMTNQANLMNAGC